MSSWDAVVVGAGPAGSATALLLARAGYRILLLDRARFPRDKACSEYLSPATTAVLARLGGGVLERVEAAAPARLFGMKVVSPTGVEAVGRFAAAHPYPPPRPYSFALPRTTFDTILRDAAAAAGAEVREGVTVEDLVWEADAVTGVAVRWPNRATGNVKRATWKCRVVVGADGLHSVVARRLGVRRRSAPQRVAFAAHFAGVAGVADVGEMHLGDAGYVGLGPIGDGITTVALVVPRARLGRDPGLARAPLPGALERFPGLCGRFETARPVRPVLATGPFAQRSRPVTADGACLVGDAADFFDPFTGQGIYSALRGAELLAAVLEPVLARRGCVTRAALAPYRRARRREFSGKWVLERLVGLGTGWAPLGERVVRRLARRPELADLFVGAAGNVVPARAVLTPRVLAALLW
ncbi:MAG: NAD(P)/FAD-dependent oxidoreductase [Gemmatimonadales bacterium]